MDLWQPIQQSLDAEYLGQSLQDAESHSTKCGTYQGPSVFFETGKYSICFNHRILWGASLKINAPLCNVIYYNQILNVISRYTDVVLDSDSLSQINHQLRSIPKATKNDKQQHIQKVKEVIMKNETAVLNRKCPRCGGQLVCRNGKYGSFYGCSNYPYCKYTFNG